MKRETTHNFYLLKAKKELDIGKDILDLDVLTKNETGQYILIADCWFHDDFMEFIGPLFTNLTVKLKHLEVSMIKDKLEAAKLVKICTGWSMIIREMAEHVIIGDKETKFKSRDLLYSIEKLKDMAEQVMTHDNYIIRESVRIIKREQVHDFYLLKVEMSLLEPDVLSKKETEQYDCLMNCRLNDDWMKFIAPSLTSLTGRPNLFAISLMKGKAEASKMIRLCTGGTMIIHEMAADVIIGEWGTKFKRKDLLISMEKLKDMAEQMAMHNDYTILYCGI